MTVSEDIRNIKKELLIEKLVELRTLSKAAKACDVPESTAYMWLHDDPEFKQKYEIALRRVGDSYIDLGDKYAHDPDHPMSGAMTMFFIKRYHPEFRENPKAIPAIQDNRTVNILVQSEETKTQVERLISGQRGDRD